MAGLTNRGKYKLLGWGFRAVATETNTYLALLTSATSPTADTNLMSDHTQIATGNGYADGGYSLTPGATDFDVWTEDDGNDRGLIQIKDVVWTAAAGPIPASGSGARSRGGRRQCQGRDSTHPVTGPRGPRGVDSL